MILLINKRYLLLSISYAAQDKRMLFYNNGQLVSDLIVRLDEHCPDTIQVLDMNRFFGKTLTVEIEPEMTFTVKQTNEIDNTGLYQEKYRPTAHFTAARGWINDPNGLVWANNRYHLFFQHNPAGRDWGNMHWGHAVSTDLLHWEQQDIALFPDEMGTMFSGSAIVDTRNRTGLKETDQDVILLFYTAAGGSSRQSEGQPFTQCLAYSTDGGITFRKYAGNPLVRELAESNRDPKVIYNPELDCYYMVLFLIDNRFCLLVSDDLLNWKWHQELTLPEDSECPDLYPLALDGNMHKCTHKCMETYWVLSGASDRYLVGKFRSDGCFQPVQSAKRLHYGTNSYAAQTFSGVTDGRTLRIAWNTAGIPDSPFNCSMCIPTEMSLKNIDEENWLCTMPVREIETLYVQQHTDKMKLKAGETFACLLAGKAQDIRLCISSADNASFQITFLGFKIDICPKENSLKCKESTMPLFMNGDNITLRILTDKNAVEIFVDQGEAFLCVGHIADYNLNRLIITAGEGALTVHEITVAELSNIWDHPTK